MRDASCSHEALASEEDSDESSDTAIEETLPFMIRYPRTINALALAIYLAAGIAFLSVQQEWTPLTAFYVVVQIITTIGYGDITVTHHGKIFMTVYVLLGTLLVANIVNSLCDILMQQAEQSFDESLSKVRSKLIPSEDKKPAKPSVWQDLAHAVSIYLFFVVTWATFFATYEACTCSYGSTHADGCLSETCPETGGYTLTPVEAVYMAVITFSTVGFGDYSPKTQLGRLVGSVWMLLGVLSFGNVVAAVSKVIAGYTSGKKRQTRVTRALFDHIDTDNTGEIDMQECWSHACKCLYVKHCKTNLRAV